MIVLFSLSNDCFAQIVKNAIDENTLMEGFVDINGNWVVMPKYETTSWDEENQIGYIENFSVSQCGVVDKYGKIIVPLEYERIYYRCNYFYVEKNGNKGVVKINGDVLIPCEYSYIWYNEKANYFGVQKNIIGKTLHGAVNENGELIIPCEFEELTPCYTNNNWSIETKNKTKDLFYVKNNEFTGVYNRNGKIIVKCEYPQAFIYNGGISVKNKDGYCGVYDFDGNIIFDIKYSNFLILDFAKYTRINIGGIPNNKDEHSPSGGKWGIVEVATKKILMPCEYDDVKIASEADGLFTMNIGGKMVDKKIVGGKWGLYANGKEIVACQYDEPVKFDNDVATVKIAGEVKMLKNPLKDGSQIQIAEIDGANKKKKAGGPAVSRYPAPNSDVDKNIPVASIKNENTFAFIIANENYPDAPVPYALNDGRMFKEYCVKTLGIPEKNISMHEDATYGNIISAVEKLKNVANAYDGDASVIFYYAGHGFPDEKQNTAYLLPIDGNASDIKTTGYSLAKLYKDLQSLNVKSSIVFLDACFSGAKREDKMLASSRGVAVKVKEEAPQGNMVVFSASQGDETAHQLEDKGHGLFTYYLLKGLQLNGSDVTLGKLTDYVTKQVKRQSVVINDKLQTPTVIPAQTVINTWKTMKMR